MLDVSPTESSSALSHSIPSGSAEEVLETALDALLEREAKRKGLLVKKPRRPAEKPVRASITGPLVPAPVSPPLSTNGAVPPASKRHRKAVPAHVRRDVLKRDEGKCQATLHDGTLCGSKVRAELDHVVPDALGGQATLENLRVTCSAHNRLAADMVFGERLMDLFGTKRK